MSKMGGNARGGFDCGKEASVSPRLRGFSRGDDKRVPIGSCLGRGGRGVSNGLRLLRVEGSHRRRHTHQSRTRGGVGTRSRTSRQFLDKPGSALPGAQASILIRFASLRPSSGRGIISPTVLQFPLTHYWGTLLLSSHYARDDVDAAGVEKGHEPQGGGPAIESKHYFADEAGHPSLLSVCLRSNEGGISENSCDFHLTGIPYEL